MNTINLGLAVSIQSANSAMLLMSSPLISFLKQSQAKRKATMNGRTNVRVLYEKPCSLTVLNGVDKRLGFTTT